MNRRGEKTELVLAVEALMLEKFRLEPFHNLYLRGGHQPTTPAYGGTCSDKTLSFQVALRELGIAGSLHTACVRGEEIHRLVKLRLADRSYFADVGNGWPAIELYPLDDEVSYACFGMRFRSVIQGRRMSVYNIRNGLERRQMEVAFDGKGSEEVLADIAARFDGSAVYPFSHGIRFSQVVGDRFLFLRDDRLEIYSETEAYREVTGVDQSQLRETIKRHFGFDISVLMPDGLGIGR